MKKYLFQIARKLLNFTIVTIIPVFYAFIGDRDLPYYFLGLIAGSYLSYYSVGAIVDIENFANLRDNYMKYKFECLLDFYDIKYNLVSNELQVEIIELLKQKGFIDAFAEVQGAINEYLNMMTTSPQVAQVTPQLNLSNDSEILTSNESEIIEVSQNLENIGLIPSQDQLPVSETHPIPLPRRCVPNFWAMVVSVAGIIIILI